MHGQLNNFTKIHLQRLNWISEYRGQHWFTVAVSLTTITLHIHVVGRLATYHSKRRLSLPVGNCEWTVSKLYTPSSSSSTTAVDRRSQTRRNHTRLVALGSHSVGESASFVQSCSLFRKIWKDGQVREFKAVREKAREDSVGLKSGGRGWTEIVTCVKCQRTVREIWNKGDRCQWVWIFLLFSGTSSAEMSGQIP